MVGAIPPLPPCASMACSGTPFIMKGIEDHHQQNKRTPLKPSLNRFNHFHSLLIYVIEIHSIHTIFTEVFSIREVLKQKFVFFVTLCVLLVQPILTFLISGCLCVLDQNIQFNIVFYCYLKRIWSDKQLLETSSNTNIIQYRAELQKFNTFA
jgi:hypothetical protein